MPLELTPQLQTLRKNLHSVSLSLSLLSLSRGDRLSFSSSSFLESPLEDQSSDIVRAEIRYIVISTAIS